MKNEKCQVISIVNFKGGVGKSTVTFNLGYELSQNGYKVLLVDFDAQGNLTRFSNVLETGTDINSDIIEVLNVIMQGGVPTADPIYTVNSNIDIIPCTVMKEKWMIDIQTVMVRETILKRYLDLVKDKYDYDFILIDNAPSINIDLQNSLSASDYFLIVAEPDMASLDGTNAVINAIRQINLYINKDLRPLGIVLNKYESRTSLHSIMPSAFGGVGDNYYLFNVRLPKSIDAPSSEAMGMAISEYAKGSKLSEAYKEFSQEFLSELKKWKERNTDNEK